MSSYVSPYHKMTAEIREKIIELWQKEMTGSEISAQLGVSRNSVIGVVYRAKQNGIFLRGKNGKELNKRENIFFNKSKIEKHQNKKPPKEKKKHVEKIIMEKPKIKIEIFTSCEAVDLNGLTYNSCRFIVEEGDCETTKYCGKKIDRSSYCKDHYAICYVPSRFSMQKLLSS